ncbi:MAG: aminotransferase [Acidobacteria bacterium]|nr:MAG: aminotransferase [Acidobacteriota bacterium]
MYRRDFLVRTGQAIGAVALASALRTAEALASKQSASDSPNWEEVRRNFNLAPDLIHMSGFFLASHPKAVRDAIEAHRLALDANPIEYWFANTVKSEAAVAAAAAHYLGVDPADIALTDSTTMGLGLLYSGLKLRANQEILTTTHDHYSTETSLRLRAERTGASVHKISLYRDAAAKSLDEIVGNVTKSITPQTRVLAVTWVHSCTGVKLPLRAIADALKPINADRAEQDRVLLCVDGVHGLGVDGTELPDLGCDFFIAGCHKWMFGPRGTGLVWGTPTAWSAATATIPTFDDANYEMWMELRPKAPIPIGAWMSPGGFHSFEHRWALDRAFQFHQSIGKPRVAERIHSLNRQLKEGLAKMSNIKLYTPMEHELSAGIVCFDVQGMQAQQVVDQLRKKKIIASVTPYKMQYARLSPGLLNSPPEVEAVLAAIRELRA